MADSAGSDLTRHTAEVPLIDQHVHGCWLTEGNRRRFENALNEANTEPLADFDSGFDSQLGFAVRNHCAPILGLPRHVDPQTYWDRRSQFSEAELARRFLQAAGVTDWLVETGIGYDVSGMASVAGLGELSGSHAHEVVRLEQVAEQAVQASGDYASAFNEILRRRAATAVATKSILAYRGGFDGDLTEPAVGVVDVGRLDVSGGPASEEVNPHGSHQWFGERIIDQRVIGPGGHRAGGSHHRRRCSDASCQVPRVVVGARHRDPFGSASDIQPSKSTACGINRPLPEPR